MKIVYLNHSGFAVLGEEITLVFDFYKDTVSDKVGILHNSILQRKGKFYVFSSHTHYDHFQPLILDWKNHKDVQYIFSDDIQCEASSDIHWLKKGEHFQDEHIKVEAFGSTDAGISFAVTMEGKTLFHAGDLNNWHWKEEYEPEIWQGYERDFLSEINDIKKQLKCVDFLMFPIDPRLGKEYMRGGEQWLQNIQTKVVAPMHFGKEYEKAEAFKAIAAHYNTRFFSISKPGDVFML